MRGNVITESRAALQACITNLHAALNADARQQELDVALDDYCGLRKDGTRRYAPPAEIDKVTKGLAEEQNRRASEALFALGARIREDAPICQGTVEAAKQALPPLAQWLADHDAKGCSMTDELLVDMRERLVVDAFERQYREASPSAALAAYQQAIDRGDASFIRSAEQQHAGGTWPRTVDGTDVKEIAAVQALSRRMAEVREARVPQELRDWHALLQEANRQYQRAVDLHKVRPVRPAA